MGLLYDSDNPDSIPDGVEAAGYCDGYASVAWAQRGWPRFPGALRIAVFASTNDGHALDVESGDASPSEAPAWVLRRRSAGILRPWVYCNRDNRSAVESALAVAGLSGAQVALWVATDDGTVILPAGPYPIAAVQYLNQAHGSGGHYDLSIVNEAFGPGGGLLSGGFGTMTDADIQANFDRLFRGVWTGPLNQETPLINIVSNVTNPMLADLKTRVELIEQSLGLEHSDKNPPPDPQPGP